jgi:hypothetical protein
MSLDAANLDTLRLLTDLDLPIDPDDDLVPTAGGDLPTLSGRPNLIAAISRRLVTSPGSMLYRPTYGCGVLGYLGQANSPAVRAKLGTVIRANLLLDRRLKDVSVSLAVGTGETGAVDGSALTISLVLTLRDGTTSPLVLTVAR